MEQEFIKGEEYIYIGPKINFYTEKEPDIKGHYILGKFIAYRDFPLHGDIIPNAKAVFENGTVDCGQYINVISKELAHKKIL